MSLKPYLYIFTSVLFLISSCKKFIQVDVPTTQLVSSSVFTSDATAKSALDGIYSQMIAGTGIANTNITLYCGLSSDEMDNYSTTTDQNQIYSHSIIPENRIITSLWSNAYSYIYDANAALEGLNNNSSVSVNYNQELQGEAKFIRAFCYFYLTNLYGDVPLILTTNYKTNMAIHRSGQDSVYGQIIKDLNDAVQLLVRDYSFSKNERTRPNKYAAMALLARAYLYTGRWAKAEQMANNVINNNAYQLQNNLDSVFLKNSQEAIWQLAPVVPNQNTNEENVLHFITTPLMAALAPDFISSFEEGDLRRKHWLDSATVSGIKYYCPFKYKVYGINPVVTEYYMMLRLAEQFLIRAEARAEQNKITGSDGAIADLNTIRHRSGLPDYNAADDQQSILIAVLNERKHEFFAEWGHRWFDLKRTNNANAVLRSKPNWQPTDVLYPIPQSEIANDPNLTQNQGYEK